MTYGCFSVVVGPVAGSDGEKTGLEERESVIDRYDDRWGDWQMERYIDSQIYRHR